jgi:hypothetical protein
LSISALAAVGGALATLFPWYGVGGWHSLAPGTGPTTEFNALTIDWLSGWQFGARTWGFVLLGLALAVLAVAAVYWWMDGSEKISVLWPLGLAVAASLLIAVSLLEASAMPPFGDEPALTYTWGALVGVFAAGLSAISSWIAFTSAVSEKRWVRATRFVAD